MHPATLAFSGEIKLPAKLIVVSDVAFDIKGRFLARREMEDVQSLGRMGDRLERHGIEIKVRRDHT
jgi:hypothetical protein